MKKKMLFPILFCIIFILLIATITGSYKDFLTAKFFVIKEMQEKEQITQSFANQKSPEELSKRISEFTPDILDKSAITTEITQFARESNIEIFSISVDDKITRTKTNTIDDEGNATSSTGTNEGGMVNTLKSVNISLNITGGKREIYAFLQKLTQSKRYIGINTVSLSFVKGLDNVEGTINAITYYK